MQKAMYVLFVMEIPKYQVVQAISHTNVNENVLCTSTVQLCLEQDKSSIHDNIHIDMKIHQIVYLVTFMIYMVYQG